MLSEGETAPEFEARNQDGDTVSASYDEPTVVYFYPKDATPGCESEANSFEKERDAYDDAGVRVYGVSTDTVESHADFADDLGLSFDLLADPDGDIAEAFGVPVENGYARRSTFVVADGEVVRVYDGVSPDGHGRDVLLDILDDGLAEM